MALHNLIGREGEVEARKFLESKGYQVIEVNWRSGHREIDIIALLNGVYIFVEVKTRTGKVSDVEDLLNTLKIESFIGAVNDYMEGVEEDAKCRIDLVIVSVNGNQTSINHIEDAVSP